MVSDTSPFPTAQLEDLMLHALESRSDRWRHPVLRQQVHQLVELLQPRVDQPVNEWTDRIRDRLRDYQSQTSTDAASRLTDGEIEQLLSMIVAKLEQLRRIARRRRLWVPAPAPCFG